MKIPKRIPTFLGIILIIIILSIVAIIRNNTLAPSRASGSQEPKKVHISNVTESSFTISWLTESQATGTILISTFNKNNQIYFDERDAEGKLGRYTTHSVTVKDATPETQYSIKILSNGNQYVNNNQSYTILTPQVLPLNSNGLGPAYGTVLTTDGARAVGSLVYLTIEGGQEFSALTKPSGLWLIPLNQTRTNDFKQYLPISNRMTETIAAWYNNVDSTAITDTLNDSPVPEMVIDKSYDFRHIEANRVNAPQPLAQNPVPSKGAVLGKSVGQLYTVTLTQPAQGSALTSSFPLIAGTGNPDKYVGISLGITNPQSGSAKVDANGLWNFTPKKPLGAGKQSVTILSTDLTGKPVAITHMFEILKQGTQILGDATPSGTLTPTAILTETPSETPLIATPSEIPSTISGQAPPTTGNELPVIILLIMGMGLLFIGGSLSIRSSY
jgi:hypothetical protein